MFCKGTAPRWNFWEYYPGKLLSPDDFQEGKAPDAYTYAGEHPNLSESTGSPYGVVTYRLILQNREEEAPLSLWLPEPLCAAKVYLGGELAGKTAASPPIGRWCGTEYTPSALGLRQKSSSSAPSTPTIIQECTILPQ